MGLTINYERDVSAWAVIPYPKRRMGRNIILWTVSSPDPLTQNLASAGYRVWEALALSEVTFLCDNEDIDAVVIRSEVDDQRAAVLGRHYITLKLKPTKTASTLVQLPAAPKVRCPTIAATASSRVR